MRWLLCLLCLALLIVSFDAKKPKASATKHHRQKAPQTQDHAHKTVPVEVQVPRKVLIQAERIRINPVHTPVTPQKHPAHPLLNQSKAAPQRVVISTVVDDRNVHLDEVTTEERRAQTERLRILVFSPKVGLANVKYLGKVADALVDAGHQVHVLSPSLHTDVHSAMSGKALVKDIDLGVTMDNHYMDHRIWFDQGPSTYVRFQRKYAADIVTFCEEGLMRKDIHEWVGEQNFDLSISELGCFDSVFRNAGVNRSITVQASNPNPVILQSFGISNGPSYVPGNMPFSADMSYLERLSNLIFETTNSWMIRHQIFKPIDIIGRREMGANYVDMEELSSLNSYLIVNNDELLDFPRPLSSQWIYAGGLRPDTPKALDKTWSSLLDSHHSGTILMSFSSNLRSSDMPFRMKYAFLSAFAEFPSTLFIWKYENATDNFAVGHSNVVSMATVPQLDLLNDPRVIALISNADMDSIFECIQTGKPMITLPVFGDDMRNSRMVEAKGMAVSLKKSKLTSRRISHALREILQPNYKEEAVRLRDLMRNKPFTAEEKLVKTVEFAARFDVLPQLRSNAIEMPFLQYYMIDIIIPLILSLVAVVGLIVCGINYVIKKERARKDKLLTKKINVVKKNK